MLVDPLDLALAAHCADIPAPVGETVYIPGRYSRFDLFCRVQLYTVMYPGLHYRNARVIAKVPENRLQCITMNELINMGWEYVR